jgi:hypothetical protein
MSSTLYRLNRTKSYFQWMNYSYFQMEGRLAHQFKTRINFPDDLIKARHRIDTEL